MRSATQRPSISPLTLNRTTTYPHTTKMSTMQAAADARKAKLAALKKRKTMHDNGDTSDSLEPSPAGSVTGHSCDLEHRQASKADCASLCRADKPEVFKFRNYDPATGGMRKHQRTDEQDTVEKQVEGLTEQAIAQEEAARNQELVSGPVEADLGRRRARARMRRLTLAPSPRRHAPSNLLTLAGSDQHPTEEGQLGLEAGPRAQAGQAQGQDRVGHLNSHP